MIGTSLPFKYSLPLSCLFFILLIGGYFFVSQIRHAANPGDKITPNLHQLKDGIVESMTPDTNGGTPLLNDTFASLQRFFIGIGFSVGLSLFLALGMGLFPFVEALLMGFVLFFGKIPPLAILPILFIVSGLGEPTKILLIVIGIVPSITLDLYLKIKSIPRMQFVKALTLGANTIKIIHSIVLPQIIPQLFYSLRVNLLNVWLFLIASEAIASSEGLGYRIFLVRRYLAMNIIIPYVLFIAMLCFFMDFGLQYWIKKQYPWFNKS